MSDTAHAELPRDVHTSFADLARDLLELQAEALDAAVLRACARIGEALGIDAIRAFVVSDDGTQITNPIAWSATGAEPVPAVPRAEIADLELDPKPAVMTVAPPAFGDDIGRQFARLGLGDAATVLAVNLSHDGAEFGTVAFTTVAPRQWGDWDTAVARHLSVLLSGLLANRRATTSRLRVEGFLATILSSSPDVILVIDGAGIAHFMSSGATEQLGYRAEDLLGRPILDIVHPADRPAVAERVLRAFQGVEPDPRATIDLRVRTAAGEWKWMECNGEPLIEGGAVTSLVVNARDITERRAERAALEELVQRYGEIWEHSPTGMAIVSIDGTYLDVNPAHCRLLGFERDQLVGKHVTHIVHPADVDALIEATVAIISNRGDRAEVDVRMTRADGRDAWGRVGVSLVYDSAGEPLYAVGTVEDITERLALENQLQHEATHDALTGLPQRKVVLEHLERILAAGRRHDGTVAVMFIDLDHFKHINDAFGHAAGDQLLQQFANRLASVTRAGDMAARHSGDEFVVVCSGLDDSDRIGNIAQRLLDELDRPFTVDGVEVFVHASIGVAVADDDVDATGLLRRADAAAYRAKEQGRNRYALFDDEMRNRVTHRLDTEDALRQAITADELTLWYQPIIAVETGQTVAMEGLLRWDRPGHGIVAPGTFIEVAERAGLMLAIGRRVLEIGCTQLATWRDGVWPDARLSLNLSARQLMQADFADELQRCLYDTGVDPGALYFEISEAALMDNVAAYLPMLRRIKALGVGLAIDDFGTGYSSLSQLQRLPVDVLKLDRSFVNDLGGEGAAIVKSVMHLATTLGKHLIAEGVEHRAQADALLDLGCRYMQGFYFSRPVTEPQATMLATGRAQIRVPNRPIGTRATGPADRSEPSLAGFTSLFDV